MPKGSRVKTSYTKAARTPSKRRRATPATAPKVELPKRSALSAYIEDNAGCGLTVRELIEQFQEYDCEHPKTAQRVVAAGSTYRFVLCESCQRVEKKLKPGVKSNEN